MSASRILGRVSVPSQQSFIDRVMLLHRKPGALFLIQQARQHRAVSRSK